MMSLRCKLAVKIVFTAMLMLFSVLNFSAKASDSSLCIKLQEDFSTAVISGNKINPWLTISNPSNTTVGIESGRLKITTGASHPQWENTVKLNVLSNPEIANVYKAIRNGGAAYGNTFTAATTKLGRLSYEFDISIPASGSTVVLFNTGKGSRYFRINTGTSSSTGFFAGTSQRLDSFFPYLTYKVKVVFDFENQNVSYYINDSLKGTSLFTDTIYNSERQITDDDVFSLALGVANGQTAYFDNIVITYEAKDYKLLEFETIAKGNAYTVKGRVVNPFSEQKNVSLIMAAYGGPFMVYADVCNVAITKSDQTVFEKVFTVPQNVAYNKVKIFVWKDMKSLKPLIEYVVPAEHLYLAQNLLVTESGRYRVYGTISNSGAEETEIRVLKNGEVFWKQIVLTDEASTIDVRMLGQIDDVITVETSDNLSVDLSGLDIVKSLGIIPVCEASQSQGYTYTTTEEITLSSLIGSTQGDGAEYFTRLYDTDVPMVYSSKRWNSNVGISYDRAYISADTVLPGNCSDAVIKVAIPKDGTIKLSGKLPVDTESDGVLVKISLNDELLWSNRVGGERSVRWDEPYDVSYFVNEINATANVKKGDKLEFSFGRWRIVENDELDISDIKLSYISGDAVSETTRWKLEQSIVVDAKNGCVYKNGRYIEAKLAVQENSIYMSEADVSSIFGSWISSSADSVVIDNENYMLLEDIAENDGKAFVQPTEDMMIVYDMLPVFFGHAEISEIETARQNGNLY